MIYQRRNGMQQRDQRIALMPIERAERQVSNAFFRGIGYGLARALLRAIGLR